MSNKEDIRKHKEICNQILALSPRIRYVGMINRFGKTIAGNLRPGIRPLFKPEQARDEFFLASIREFLRKDFNSTLGKIYFTLTVHEKVKIVSFTSDSVTFYLSMEKDTPYDEIVKIVEKASKFKT
ncbi:MAG: hypothetical protein QXU32_10225 [Nitrososphaerales archaeon]